MRFRNAHTSSIDGVEPGAVGDFNPAAVRGLVEAGLLVPVEGGAELPSGTEMLARFDHAWAEREKSFAADLAAKDARITELEVEAAQLRMDLEAATAPKAAKKGQP